ncbi:MAG: DUF899 family protein [Deltaproteobacteria bacterium]|jgi:predicted dithiol-disulfide oxidoreductase (DUF899 family)|nr:DUF899 family protein [Deltaproteobacteria bacterium]
MSNSFEKFEDQICAQEKTVRQEMEKLFALHKSRPPATVKDYTFATAKGPVKLSELFGEKKELILIHNMGKQCVYCTLWADGFNGFSGHLENRAGFVLINNDSVEEQTAFAASRGWKFKLASAKGTSFSKDMGFLDDKAGKMPGASVYTKMPDGTIQHRTRAGFGPGDLFSSIWSLFDLLPAAQPGAEDWSPKFSYEQKQAEPFRFSPNIALNVRNIDQAVSFYRDTLGFTVGTVKDFAEGVPMLKGGTTIWLDAVSQDDEANVGKTAFEFVVADLEASKKVLVAKGCKPVMTTTGADHEGEMIVDPFGMKFHLYKAKPKSEAKVTTPTEARV